MVISGPKNTASLEGFDEGNEVANEGNEGNEDQQLLNNVEEIHDDCCGSDRCHSNICMFEGGQLFLVILRFHLDLKLACRT